MNPAPFDHPAWAALSFVPILFFLAWLFFVLGAAIFMIVMILRFVKAHERLAKNIWKSSPGSGRSRPKTRREKQIWFPMNRFGWGWG